jgi:mannose-P-dolichol utilization defect protein 1
MEALQSIFRGIAWLGWPVTIVTLIMGDASCANTLFYRNFLDKKCLSLAISKALSYVLILGSCLYKVPIVVNILKQKSGRGLNMTAMYLETSAIFANVIYSYLRHQPLTTYGDLFAILAANFAIIVLVWIYGTGDKKEDKFGMGHILLVTALMGAFVAAMFQVPSEHVALINWYSTVVVTLSRIPQIISNQTTGDIGVQSAVTVGNASLGTAAKLFVVFVEAPDFALFAGNFLAFLCNVILFFQIMFIKPKKQPAEDDAKQAGDAKATAKSSATSAGSTPQARKPFKLDN